MISFNKKWDLTIIIHQKGYAIKNFKDCFEFENKLSSIIYKYAYLQHTQNSLDMPWIKAVKNILDNCGLIIYGKIKEIIIQRGLV